MSQAEKMFPSGSKLDGKEFSSGVAWTCPRNSDMNLKTTNIRAWDGKCDPTTEWRKQHSFPEETD